MDLFSDETKLEKENYYGAVSWKFGKKANLFPNDVFEFIKDNPEKDLYLVNPYPELPHLYENPWIQGENVHPGLLKISQLVFDKSQYKIDLRNLSFLQLFYCLRIILEKLHFLFTRNYFYY